MSLPDVAMIPKLVKYLGVSADILLGCNEPETATLPEIDSGNLLCQDQINSIFNFVEEKEEKRERKNNPKTVLVTDDVPLMRMLICDMLNKADYKTLTAANGKECLSLLDSQKADICTLDIGMPEMNGLEALAKIKSKCPEIKVIMVSAQSSKENVLKARELGAEYFIAKPFNGNNLLKILDLFEN